MTQYEQIVQKVIESVGNVGLLSQSYSAFLAGLFDLRIWTSSNSIGRMVLWRDLQASKSSFAEFYESPGLYLFEHSRCPIYLGKTENTLWRRLNGRYVGGESSQFNLAAKYSDSIRKLGTRGFPLEIRAKLSTVRLDHAVALAKAGIDQIWIAIMPIEDRNAVKPLERALIPIANQWNLEHGYERLLNKQHARG